eukprot:5464393-Pleurochrysis_carterae.AAC.1
MGVQAETQRFTQGQTMRSRLCTGAWSRLRANFLCHNAGHVTAYARIPGSATKSLHAQMGFRGGLPPR